MNIEEMDLDLSNYELVVKEIFKGRPDCPQMVLSAKGIRFNRQTYDYFEGTEYYYFLFGKDKKTPKVDKMGILMGSIIAVMGYGALAIICGGFSPATIFNYIESSFILPMIIPFLMIFAGVFAVVKGIFFYKPQD